MCLLLTHYPNQLLSLCRSFGKQIQNAMLIDKLKPENLCSVILYLSEVRSYIKFLFHLECHISLYKLFKCNFLNVQCSPPLLLNNYCTNAHW